MKALALVLLAGCGVTNFDVEQPIEEQTIPGSALPDILDMFFEVPLELDIREQIEAMETGPIDGVFLKSLTLTITTPDDDWSFVRSIDVFIAGTADGSTLPMERVASVEDPGASTTMTFVPVAGLNLLPYVNEGGELSADADADAPPDDVTYDGRAVFEVHPL